MYREKKYGKAKIDFDFIISVAVLLILGLMFFVVPWARNERLAHPIVVSKTFYFIYFLTTVLVVFVLHVFSGKRTLKLKLSKIDISLFLLVGYIIFNRYVIQVYHSFSIRFIELLGLIVLYSILRFIPKKQYPWLLLFIVLAGIAQAMLGILQAVGHYPSLNSNFGMTGSFFNPGPFAGFLIVVWVLALAMYFFKNQILDLILLEKNDRYVKILNRFIRNVFHFIPLLGIAVILIVLPAIRSRAAWMAVIAGGIFIYIYKYRFLVFSWIRKYKGLGFYKRGFLFLSVFGIVLLGLFGIYKFKKDSADGRLLIWKVSSNIVKEHPVSGVGYDRFKAHYMDAQASYFNENSNPAEGMLADNTYYAFNHPLQFTVENGLIGLVLLCTIGFLCLKIKSNTKNKYLKYLVLGTLSAFVIFGMFSYPAHILPIKMVVVLMLALLAIIDSQKISFQFPRAFSSKPKNYLLKFSVVCIGIMVIGGVLYRTMVLKNGYERWQQALTYYNIGLYENSVDKFEMVYPVFHNNGDFLMQYGKALAMAGQYGQTRNVLEQAKNYLNTTIIETTLGNSYKNLNRYQEAEKAYQKAANMIPNRFYPEYLLAKLYNETGQMEKAFSKAVAILAKEVKIPSKAIEEIKAEMKEIAGKKEKQIKENPPGLLYLRVNNLY